MLDLIMQNLFVITGVLGVLAFMTTVIVEVIKDLPRIKKIPTKIVVITISMVVTVLALIIYTSYSNTKLLWYYVVLSVFAGFLVAYISMYGWDTFKELWVRFNGTKEE